MSVAIDIKAVVQFWTTAGPSRWFKKDEQFDAEFGARFHEAHFQAARGELEHWMNEPEGALALLVDAGMDQRIDPALRAFCYLPFEHSESPEDQQRSLALNQQLDANTYHWAREHAEIIERFGRFPHRNAALGRVTSDEEQAFLMGGGFSG